jgi:hypothetical protein
MRLPHWARNTGLKKYALYVLSYWCSRPGSSRFRAAKTGGVEKPFGSATRRGKVLQAEKAHDIDNDLEVVDSDKPT